MTETVALVGAAGGAGTTRLTVECGGLLARTGRDVAIVDVAFATQGLSSYVEGTIEADVTALLTGEAELGDVLYDHPADLPGRLALAPAKAPFERLARAQTAGAAGRLERQLAAASLSHDVVLVDTPPIDGNQAVAAVNAADSIAVVTPDTLRGGDALSTMLGRLADVGQAADAVLANRATGFLPAGTPGDAAQSPARPDHGETVPVPESDVTNPGECPACLSSEGAFAPAVADAVAAVLDVSPDVESPAEGRLGDLLG
jgi:cellulose biosynthesis protein BcsQ